MTKLSPRQEAFLLELDREAKEARSSRAEIEAEVRAEVQARQEAKLVKLSLLMNEARVSGIPTTRIGPAIGTKDYRTVMRIMNMARESFDAAVEQSASVNLDGVYSLNDQGELVVSYDEHGAKRITGKATFAILGAGESMFLASIDALWNTDFTVRNDVVAEFEAASGPYYEEAIEWLRQNIPSE